MVKIKELEGYLSQCDTFTNPKLDLEQYQTSPHIAARMLYAAQDKMQGSIVCDLGSGCGILSIGSIMCGASFVCGMDIDRDAIDIALGNREEILGDEDSWRLEFIQTLVDTFEKSSSRFDGFFDVVIMNPPFGTKTSIGADFNFLKVGTKLVRPGGHIYSLHKTSTRPFFLKKVTELGLKGSVLAEVNFDLPKTYKFHKEKTKDVQVDFWEFEKG